VNPRFTIRNGCVFRGEIYMSPQDCNLLLIAYQRAAKANDWWSKTALSRADQLAAAMSAAYHERAA
jgi:hypothetical protein